VESIEPSKNHEEQDEIMKIAFLTNPTELYADPPGGVQLCSQEFLKAFHSIGAVTIFDVHPTAHPWDRIRRKLLGAPYLSHNPMRESEVLESIKDFKPDIICINHCLLLRYARHLYFQNPTSKIIILSHGNQSGDDLFECAHPSGRYFNTPRVAARILGRSLIIESNTRHYHVDGVVVMSEEEEVFERWMGSPATFVFPRIVQPLATKRKPIINRVGFVGTLNHTPNSEALQRLLPILASNGFDGELRIVGGPVNDGQKIASQYAFVSYLGALDNQALDAEANSWSIALNPVFWLSRGASMKLKFLLNRGIPVITTKSGARGYKLPNGACIHTSDSAADFAQVLISTLTNPDKLMKVESVIRDTQTHWIKDSEVHGDLKGWIESL